MDTYTEQQVVQALHLQFEQLPRRRLQPLSLQLEMPPLRLDVRVLGQVYRRALDRAVCAEPQAAYERIVHILSGRAKESVVDDARDVVNDPLGECEYSSSLQKRGAHLVRDAEVCRGLGHDYELVFILRAVSAKRCEVCLLYSKPELGERG